MVNETLGFIAFAANYLLWYLSWYEIWTCTYLPLGMSNSKEWVLMLLPDASQDMIKSFQNNLDYFLTIWSNKLLVSYSQHPCSCTFFILLSSLLSCLLVIGLCSFSIFAYIIIKLDGNLLEDLLLAVDDYLYIFCDLPL